MHTGVCLPALMFTFITSHSPVMYPGAACALLENDTLRRSVLIELDGLQFQRNSRLYVDRVIFDQRVLSRRNWVKEGPLCMRAEPWGVPVQAVVFAKIVLVVTQTRPDRHSAQLKMQAQQESGAPIHKSLQCNRDLCVYILSLCLCLAVSGGVRHWHVCLHRHSHRKWCNPM